MVSKAEARRRRTEARRSAVEAGEVGRPTKQVQTRSAGDTSAPTAEQLRKPGWVKPDRGQPMYRMSAIEMLCAAKFIDQEQCDAGKNFAELRQLYMAELQTHGYGSCLADNMRSHDSGMGREEVMREYRDIERKVGGSMIAVLCENVFKTADEKIHLPGQLKAALSALVEVMNA